MPQDKDKHVKDESIDTGSVAVIAQRPIEIITAEIQVLKSQAGRAILEIGNRLIEAKEQLPHGDWLTWLKNEVEFSERHAQNFIRLAKEYSNPQALADLGTAKALTLLALPYDDRDSFINEAHVVNGEVKTVDEMSTRELEKAIRERNEAINDKEAAENRAEFIKKALENVEKRADETVEAAEKRMAEAEAEASRINAEKAALEKELEELRNAEPATMPEPDQVMLEDMQREAAEAAKKEAEAKLKKKIDKAAADKAKAEAALMEADKARKKAEQDLARVEEIQRREQEAHNEEKEAIRKELAVANAGNTTAFKLHFETMQQSVNKMLEIINALNTGGDIDLSQKLSNALKALCMGTISGVDAKPSEAE